MKSESPDPTNSQKPGVCHLAATVRIVLVMTRQPQDAGACGSAGQTAISRHRHSQELLLAKKGNSLLYVNPGQMAADAEESGVLTTVG